MAKKDNLDIAGNYLVYFSTRPNSCSRQQLMDLKMFLSTDSKSYSSRACFDCRSQHEFPAVKVDKSGKLQITKYWQIFFLFFLLGVFLTLINFINIFVFVLKITI